MHAPHDKFARLDGRVPSKSFAQAFLLVTMSALVSLPAPADAVSIASQSSSSPFPGVRLVEGRTSQPSTDFYAAYVSLCHDYVHVEASDYNGLRTTGSWASDVGAQLAINGDFFTLSGTDHVYGDAVGIGGRWSASRTGRDSAYSSDWYYQRYGWFAFGPGWVDHTNTEWVKQNDARFGAIEGFSPGQVTTALRSGTTALVSGFPQLVVEGEPIRCSSPTDSSCFPDRSDMRQRHPRTAMGLSRDKQTFIMVVVDGRSSRSSGMYGAELASLMDQLGAWTAINLDGGGSSQMWVDGRGTINRPSDGTPRGVMNHWGVFAGSSNGKSRRPGSCDLSYEALLHQPAGQIGASTTDVDGDNRADVCVRRPDGFVCHMSTGQSFSAPSTPLALSDSSGWGDRSNYATLRMGDVDADGRADVCARANAAFICWRFTGSGFSEYGRITDWSDQRGFSDPRYYSSLRLADVNADGRADACIRHRDGFDCRLSTGQGFGATFAGPRLADQSGWGLPEHFGTVRMADVNGDGRADVCARGNDRFYCWLAEADGFGARISGPTWSDANGWTQHRYWSTIRMADLDDDGLADVCARTTEGIDCHLATGQGFGSAIEGPRIGDASGWADPSNYMGIRLADITGDGLLDVCARADAGVRCWPFEGSGFGSAISGPLADDTGWYRPWFYRTLDFADVDGDGRADLCARAARGVVCWRSLGNRFAGSLFEGPAWSDDADFGDAKYYSTMRLVGPRRAVPEPPAPEDVGVDLDAGPDTDTSPAPDATISSDSGAPQDSASQDSGPPSDTNTYDAVDTSLADAPRQSDTGVSAHRSCACRHIGPSPVPKGMAVALGLLFAAYRRRQRLSSCS